MREGDTVGRSWKHSCAGRIKAGKATESARVLLERGDLEGATNRAYYAVFHAARAALVQVGQLSAAAKTHSTVIGLFGKHLVQSGQIAAEHGRMLNRCHQLRNLADYDVSSIDAEKVSAAVDGAETFVRTVQALINGPVDPAP